MDSPPPPHIKTRLSYPDKTQRLEHRTVQLSIPLLNPKEIDYKTIDADLALQLHLPPQTPYKFILMRYGLSGGLAMGEFLQKQNVELSTYHQLLRWQELSGMHTCLFVDCHWSSQIPEIQEVLVAASGDIVMLVRDPISRLKTMINHGCYIATSLQPYDTFSIDENPYYVVNRKGYHDEHYNIVCNKPFITNSLLWFYIQKCLFSYYTLFEDISKYNITYIDMRDIALEKAFDTMSKLATKFNFSAPIEQDRMFYETIRFDEFSYHLLPLICLIPISRNIEIKCHITAMRNRDIDLICINHTLFNMEHPLLEKVAFSVTEKDLQILQDNTIILQQVEDYMIEFLDNLKQRADYLQRNKKCENDILEFFRGDKDLCRKFKAMLDKELVHIKAHRPDIIASWKYYQEFEKICMEATHS